MDDIICRKKLIKDLRGIQDVLTGQGDPFLASVLRVAIECVERQEPVPYPGTTAVGVNPRAGKRFLKAMALVEKMHAEATLRTMIHDPVAYAALSYLESRR